MHTGMMCTVVRNILVDSFKDYLDAPLKEGQILVMPDMKPPPSAGSDFIAVYGNDWSPVSDDTNRGLYYQMGVSCTLTRRSPTYPSWQRGAEMFGKQFSGMASICLKIIRSVSQSLQQFSKMAELEEYLAYRNDAEGVYLGQFFEYLRFQRCDPTPIPVYEDHFSARNDHLQDPGGEAIMGYVMTVEFGRAVCGVNLDG